METDENLVSELRKKYDLPTPELLDAIAEAREDALERVIESREKLVQHLESAEAVVCCPFCGQVFEITESRDARLLCTCDGARKWQAAEDRRERLCLAIDKLFGEDCRAESPEFEPLGDAELCALYEIAGYAAHGLIAGVSVTVRDGSVCRIGEKVRRSVSVKREIE